VVFSSMQVVPALANLDKIVSGLGEAGVFWGLFGSILGPAIWTAIAYVVVKQLILFPIRHPDLGIQVHRIKNEEDPVFILGRSVYEGDARRLGDTERTSWESKRKLIRRQRSWLGKIGCILSGKVVFLAGLRKRADGPYRVASFLQFVVSHLYSVAFVSYFITSRTPANPLSKRFAPSELTMLMLAAMQRKARSPWVPGRQYPIIAEVEDPDESGVDANLALARIGLFDEAARAGGWTMKEVGIEYYQPHVDLGFVDSHKGKPLKNGRERHEKRLILLYFSDTDGDLTKRRIKRIMKFMVNIYVKAESDPARLREYSKYLRDDWMIHILRNVDGPADRSIKLRSMDRFRTRIAKLPPPEGDCQPL
jgi:hypothetical protein